MYCFCILLYAVANFREEAENFLLFETQTFKPDIVLSTKVDDEPARWSLRKYRCAGKSQDVQSSDLKTPSGDKLHVVGTFSADDDDDFVETVMNPTSGKVCAPRKKDPAISTRNITTTKRPNRKPRKFTFRVHELKPGKFTHLESAHLLKAFVLSDYAKENHNE